jgi:PAS domain S-box-containing protein
VTPDQFLSFADPLPEPMLLVMANGLILACNRAVEVRLDIPRRHLIGKRLSEVVGDSNEEIAHYLRACSRSRSLVLGSVDLQLDQTRSIACRAEGTLLQPRGTDNDALLLLRLTPKESTVGQFVYLNNQIEKLGREIVRRKQAEEVARQQAEWLRVTLNSIGDGVIVTDAQGRVNSINSVAAALIGWTKEEAVARKLDEVYHIVNEVTRATVANPALRALAEGVIVGLANDKVLISKDYTEQPVEDSAAPIRDNEGSVIGSVLIFRSVTEQRRSERAIRKNKEILELVHKIGKIGHWEWNSVTDENNWSPEIEALYGLPPGGFQGGYRAWTELIHPEDLPKAEEDVRQALKTGEYFSEFRVIWPDGSVHWIETRAHVFQDDNGQPIRIMGVNMEITDRKRAEEALRASEQRWRTMADSLPILVWTDLPNGQCDWLSSQWGAYTGIPESELLGLRWLDTVLHPDDRERTLACWTTACADEGDYDLEYRIRRYDGEYHWFKTRGVPIRNEQGHIVYWFGTCSDIEEHKRIEGALRDADRRKDEFLATLAHELRNPLAPIRNSLQILKMPGVDSAIAEQTKEMMERQVHHLVRLVDDLMDVSRVMRGRIDLRKEQVELATVVARAVETIKPLIEDRAHYLDVSMSNEPLLLNVDPVRMSQVIGNLLANAAKYTEVGGHIWVQSERVDGQAVLKVRDDGIGIAPNVLPHVFELFVQGEHAATKSQGGLGIGLTLVKNLVEMHGGTVEAISAGLGCGCEFVIKVPVAAIEQLKLNEESSRLPERRVPRPGHRLLVVDDNMDAAVSLAMLLRLNGHEVRIAHDGPSALDVISEYVPDVIFLDIGMPGMDGYEVARRIRKKPGMENRVLVALTGWGQQEDRRRTKEAGFDHHLVKPAEPTVVEELLVRLRKDFDGEPDGTYL